MLDHEETLMELQIPSGERFELEHSFPARDAAQSMYAEQTFLQAMEAYRFFYPTVSMEGVFNGARELGIRDNAGIMVLLARPRHRLFTANADTPYLSATLDLTALGPAVVELPAGPFIGLVDDHNQSWIKDMGLAGPDRGKGGKHLLLPPEYGKEIPIGYHVARSFTHKVLVAIRALPGAGGMRGALEALRQVKIYPYGRPEAQLPFIDVTERDLDGTLLRWERNLGFWQKLDEIVQSEPIIPELRHMYGLLAPLGIEKGKPFNPNAKMRMLLEKAARTGLYQMRVEAFASDRPDRLVWPDRKWEWVGLIAGDANFETANYLDLQARERWFVQAVLTSPAMFRRQPGSGSLYFLAACDEDGAYLDGGRSYQLTVPGPVPASRFWSVTAYDAETRSQVRAAQNKAVLGSLHDALEPNRDGTIDLYFGPEAPAGKEAAWVQTLPTTGFFLYFRSYGPERACFDGSWKLGNPKVIHTR